MRKRNWPQYNRQLVQRGSLTFLISPELLKDKPERAIALVVCPKQTTKAKAK